MGYFKTKRNFQEARWDEAHHYGIGEPRRTWRLGS